MKPRGTVMAADTAPAKEHPSKPFPGLRPFDVDESLIFFGREGQSDELLVRLRATRFVAVVGTSGSGKSSLVHAGLLPALRGGLMRGAGSGWRIAMFRPVNNPIGNLAQALSEARVVPRGVEDRPEAERRAAVEEILRSHSLGLIEAVRHACLASYENLLIVVDQFEELYRFEPSPKVERPKEEASAFVKLLLEVKRHTDLAIHVVITMRSDYMGESARFWGLPEAINEGQYLIPRMDDDERREAIEGPIRVFGARISAPLVNRLLNDVGDDPSRLPILQHALMRTWDYWSAHRQGSEPLGLKHYEKVGCMERALWLHADEAYGQLTKEEQVIAEKMFRRLTERRGGGREGRLPATVGEIKEITGAEESEVVDVIEVFRGEGRSFLMPPQKPLTTDTLIDISHESLIGGWDRLKRWVNEEADSAKIYLRLIDDASRYPRETGLLTDPELQVALGWHDKQKPNAVWAKRYATEFGKALASDNPPPRPDWHDPNATEFEIAVKYLKLSEDEHKRAVSRRDRKRRYSIGALAGLSILFFALAVLAFIYYKNAENAESQALMSELFAQEGEKKAVRASDDAKRAQLDAVSARREAEARAKEAEFISGKLSEALAAKEKERANALTQAAIARQSQLKLAEYGELGRATDNLIAAMSAANTGELISAYQTMRDVYASPRLNSANREILDTLTAQAIVSNPVTSEVADLTNLSEALKYLTRAQLKSSGNDHKKASARANAQLAKMILESGRDNEQASPFLEAAIDQLDDGKDAKLKAETYVRLGEISDEYFNVVDNFRKAISLFNKGKGMEVEEASVREKLGDAHRYIEKYPDGVLRERDLNSAIKEYEEAARLFLLEEDKKRDAAKVLHKLGAITAKGMSDKAVAYFEQAAKLYGASGEYSDEGDLYKQIAGIYQQRNVKNDEELFKASLKAYEKAHLAYARAIERGSGRVVPYRDAQAYEEAGYIHFRQRELGRAAENFKKAVARYREAKENQLATALEAKIQELTNN